MSNKEIIENARYLLINPRYRDVQHLQKASDIDAKNGLYAITQPHLTQPPHWALRLIDLQQRSDVREKMFQWVSDSKLPRDIFCGWWVTDADPGRVKMHIEQQMVQYTPDGRRMLLRYFDPRVLDQLVHILDDAQRYALMGPISQWGILDADRRIQCIERPSFTRGKISIRKEQWDAIARTEEVDRIRRCWQRLLDGHPLPDDHYYKIVSWLVIADEYQLDDMTDRTSFVLLGIDKGWRFDHTDIFRHLLHQHRMTSVTLTELFKQMTPDQWQYLDQWANKETAVYA